MATVPATTQPDAGGARRGGLLPQNDFFDGLSGLSVFRQLGLLIGLAASVAIGVAVVLWSQGGDYRPLYGSLERLDSAAVLDVLDTNKIKYKIDNGTGALLVEADKINEARLKLAGAGVPGDRTAGFEALNQEQPLGTSQFMETVRYRHSLEGELARTIASINSVRSARVHLAIPKESVFVREARPPSASVFVELFPGASLSAAQVKSVVNLVASSIPELKPENVTVVDQHGALLSQLVLDQPQLVEANRQLEYTHRVERQLRERVYAILAPLVGQNKFNAEVAADVDFTAVEEAGEVYNPDLPALRSEQRIEENRAAGSAGGVPGALSNQPPADGVAPEQIAANGQNQNPQNPQQQGQQQPAQGTGSSAAPAAAASGGNRSREQVVRNYELDRTLSYTKHQVGKLRRLTVAVAVDNKQTTGADGSQASVAWSKDDLERLAILVRNAVGYDAARGDIVNVVNSPFVASAGEDTGTVEVVPWYRQPWLMALVKPLLAFLAVLVLVLAVLRPAMKSLSQSARETRAAGGAGLGEMGAMGALGDETVTLSGGNNSMLLAGPDNSYENQLTAIKGLIAEDPGRVAQVVKKWVASGE
jgi:flagellar M-ring protein FliF